MRKEVRAELAKRGTDTIDRSALYLAVANAAAAVAQNAPVTPAVKTWQRVYERAGSPDF